MCELSTARHSTCPTFVVAKFASDVVGPPEIFRSYFGENVAPSQCKIWQAARATSAAPSFFKEITIDQPPPGIAYVDGGLGYNNPSELALREAAELWPKSKTFCLVSIGTGHPNPEELVDTSKQNSTEAQNYFVRQLKSAMPDLGKVNGWKKVKNFGPGVLAMIKMAKTLSSLVTDSEEAHQRLLKASKVTENPRPYFRFNVERGVGDIGLEDWKKEEQITARTITYLRRHEMEEKKIDCAKYLREPERCK
jgi:patatin-like phospholipase/acyl hydrolase